MNQNERLEAFERMLKDVQDSCATEKLAMDQMKARGKDKSATYKQYVANRLVYNRMLALFERYELIE